LARLKELKIKYFPKEENSPNGKLEKKVYSNNYRAKNVKCLMAKIRKELKSIEPTEIH
jgi:uncharacterized lipoprotein YddW (UPF0748 family)